MYNCKECDTDNERIIPKQTDIHSIYICIYICIYIHNIHTS